MLSQHDRAQILACSSLKFAPLGRPQDLMFTMKSVMGGQRGRGQERSMKVSEARAVLEDVEAERLVSEDMVRS